jgi:hypothetical protein
MGHTTDPLFENGARAPMTNCRIVCRGRHRRSTSGGGGVLDFLIGPSGGGYNRIPNRSYHVVGQAGGQAQILECRPAGNLLGTCSPQTEDRKTDWVDLSADQRRMRTRRSARASAAPMRHRRKNSTRWPELSRSASGALGSLVGQSTGERFPLGFGWPGRRTQPFPDRLEKHV